MYRHVGLGHRLGLTQIDRRAARQMPFGDADIERRKGEPAIDQRGLDGGALQRGEARIAQAPGRERDVGIEARCLAGACIRRCARR